MNFCKDCKHWTEQHDIGRCNRLTCQFNVVNIATSSARTIETDALFGCIYFEPKSKGPFVYGSDHKGNYVCHLPSQTIVGYWWKEDHARKACAAINQEWLRRE